MEIPINYLAVVAAALVNMVLGFLWYGPLFGKVWMRASGRTTESMQAMNAGLKDRYLTMNRIYLLQTIGALVMSYVMAHVIVFGMTYTQTFGVVGGLTAAFWYWLGFVAPVTIGVVLWDGMPWKVWFIQGGYFLVAMLLMGAILGSWV